MFFNTGLRHNLAVRTSTVYVLTAGVCNNPVKYFTDKNVGLWLKYPRILPAMPSKFWNWSIYSSLFAKGISETGIHTTDLQLSLKPAQQTHSTHSTEAQAAAAAALSWVGVQWLQF